LTRFPVGGLTVVHLSPRGRAVAGSLKKGLVHHQVEMMGLPPVAAYKSSRARIARRIQRSVLCNLPPVLRLLGSANARPHFRQDLESSGNSVPQFEQNTPDLHQQMYRVTQHTPVPRAGKSMSRAQGWLGPSTAHGPCLLIVANRRLHVLTGFEWNRDLWPIETNAHGWPPTDKFLFAGICSDGRVFSNVLSKL
jgi:hypothetical protein